MLRRPGGKILTKISPSILSSDFGNLREQVKIIDRAGADGVHIDVMDGHFVPNLTLGPVIISSIRDATALPFETHLMIEHPDRLVGSFAESGSDLIVVHPEAKHDMKATLRLIEGQGKKAGVAINPETSLKAVAGLLDRTDMLLVMTVHPGFSGQKFIREVLGKITAAKELIDREGLGVRIAVDGGVTLETGRDAIKAGAGELVAGTSVFKSGNVREAIERFRAL